MADELFFIAHNDRTGRAWLPARATGFGLAAGLLAELVLAGQVTVHDGLVWVARELRRPADALAEKVLGHLVRQPEHRELRTWLAFLEHSAVDQVGQRLADARLVRPVRHRRPWGSTTAYLPLDVNRAAGPAVRLARVLTVAGPVEEPDAALGGLVEAAGLLRRVLWQPDTHDRAVVQLHHAVAGLRPALRQLVAFTKAAIGEDVLAPR